MFLAFSLILDFADDELYDDGSRGNRRSNRSDESAFAKLDEDLEVQEDEELDRLRQEIKRREEELRERAETKRLASGRPSLKSLDVSYYFLPAGCFLKIFFWPSLFFGVGMV